jgi:hypothetical protein
MADLSEDAKHLIRQYMLTLVALPATLLAVVSAVGGYFLNDIATAKAYETAYTNAFNASSDIILKTTQVTSQNAGRIADVLELANKRKAELEDLIAKAKQREQDLENLTQQIKATTGIPDPKLIAAELLKVPSFETDIASATTNQLVDLKRRVEGIKLVVKTRDDLIRPFGCGGSDAADPTAPIVMYGAQEGNSCAVANKNYYKEFSLEIPPAK